jgi:hypothetical protein
MDCVNQAQDEEVKGFLEALHCLLDHRSIDPLYFLQITKSSCLSRGSMLTKSQERHAMQEPKTLPSPNKPHFYY